LAKILLIASYAKSLIRFRGRLIQELVGRGHQVIALAPEADYEKDLNELGARYLKLPLGRTGLNPLKDISSLLYLVDVYKELRPDIIFAYTIKPVIYGSLAARMAKVDRVFSMITGLGYAFTGNTVKQRVLLSLIKLLYKISLKKNEAVFFQNRDDLHLFNSLGLLHKKEQAVVINGSGVDLEYYNYLKYEKSASSFLIIARLLKDKGIAEFVEAARILKPVYPDVTFNILGPPDCSHAAIPRRELELWTADGTVNYLGESDDVRPFIADSSVYVLPSYREGTPRSVLEAMSMGRPIITTDAPGCRETVRPGENGFLVPVKNSNALAEAMEYFILHPEKVATMGWASRKLAEEKYDVHKVNRAILETLDI
jgi:glycosyltransferase involved in cell wall biosynthesis